MKKQPHTEISPPIEVHNARDLHRREVQEEWEHWRRVIIKAHGEVRPETEIASAILAALVLLK